MNTGNEYRYGALRGCYPAQLVSILKIRNLELSTVDRVALVDRLFVEGGGALNVTTGLVTVTKGTSSSGTSLIIVNIKAILGMAHLVPETAGNGVDTQRWYVNNRIDLETFNRIY